MEQFSGLVVVGVIHGWIKVRLSGVGEVFMLHVVFLVGYVVGKDIDLIESDAVSSFAV